MYICSYYSAKINPQSLTVVVATLRYSEHLVFDRTRDVEAGIFEFFVPPTCESFFLELMNNFIALGYISDFKKEENRLMDKSAHL